MAGGQAIDLASIGLPLDEQRSARHAPAQDRRAAAGERADGRGLRRSRCRAPGSALTDYGGAIGPRLPGRRRHPRRHAGVRDARQDRRQGPAPQQAHLRLGARPRRRASPRGATARPGASGARTQRPGRCRAGSACWPTGSSNASPETTSFPKEECHEQIAARIRSTARPTCASSRAAELPQLAAELREFVLHSVSQTGGHLSSNLGTVELTIALHYVFDTPHDRIVWDVGHQTYPHKILTGRRERMAHAAPARRHLRLSAPRRERVRHLRHRAFVDLDLGGARHGGRRQARRARPQGGGGDRRRRDERRHGVRGAEQRRRARMPTCWSCSTTTTCRSRRRSAR